nr:MAG TPA: replisome organizer [Caudoviricetes sp.]
MDKKEFALFASALRTYYSKENLLPNSQAMELWFRQLMDIPYPVAEATLNKWVATNKWSPSIAEIRELAAEIQNGKLPDWGEAWEETCKAISRYGYYRPKEALASLGPLTRKTVERLGFTNLCLSENPTADRANFRQCYEIVAKREQEAQVLSLPLQQIIQQLSDGMAPNSVQSLLTDKERN